MPTTMEKDNFEDYLKRIVIQSDQHTSRNSNRERVWNKINEDRKSQGILQWVMAASFALLVLVFLPYEIGNLNNYGRETAKLREPFRNDIEPRNSSTAVVYSNVKSLKPRNRLKLSVQPKKLNVELISSINSNSEKDLIDLTTSKRNNATKEPLKLAEIISVEFRPGELTVPDNDLVSFVNKYETDTIEDPRIAQSARRRLKLSFKKQQ